MRYLCSLAVIASFLTISSSASLRAADESARMAKILEQVAQTLDQAEISAELKQEVLRNLKKSLSQALAADVEVQKPAAEKQKQVPSTSGEAVADANAEASEAAQDRRDRPRQRARAAQREQRRDQRRELSRDPAAETRRAETARDEPERQRPTQDSAPQPTRYAIGVMLEQPEQPDTEGKLVITDVFPGSPAAKAGLKSGDVIRKLNGEQLNDANDVTQRVDQAGLDDKPLSLEIGRSEDVLTVEVKPSPRPGNGGAFGFGGPDWAFPALPGMPGFGGWRDPQWRFPTPPQATSTERARAIIQRLERHEQMMEQIIEQQRQLVEELRKQSSMEPETEGDTSDDD